MARDVDFASLVVGGSIMDEELFFEEGFYNDGSPIDEDELDRLARDHYDMLYDAAFQQQVSAADFA